MNKKEMIDEEINNQEYKNIFIDKSANQFICFNNCKFENCVIKLPKRMRSDKLTGFSFLNCAYDNCKFINADCKVGNSMYEI